MMVKPTVYLDTSVINFLFADDAPEKRDVTIDFFENFVKLSIYDTYVTEYVVREIAGTPDEKLRGRLLKAIDNYPVEIIPNLNIHEVDALAAAYLEQGIPPQKNFVDALHVAFCTVEKIEYLVSWNYRHLANINKERRFIAKKYELGYLHPFRIVTPFDLMSYER